MSNEEHARALIEDQAPVPPRITPSGSTVNTAAWPIVVGIIGILLATLATLGGGYELLADYVPGLAWLKDEPTRRYEGAIRERVGLLAVVEVILQLGLVVVLWFAGIGVLIRRRWGVTAARIYAIGLMAYLLLTTGILFGNWSSLVGFVDESNLGVPGSVPVKGIMIFSIVLGLLWQLVIGVGILAWFGSGRARREWMNW